MFYFHYKSACNIALDGGVIDKIYAHQMVVTKESRLLLIYRYVPILGWSMPAGNGNWQFRKLPLCESCWAS